MFHDVFSLVSHFCTVLFILSCCFEGVEEQDSLHRTCSRSCRHGKIYVIGQARSFGVRCIHPRLTCHEKMRLHCSAISITTETNVVFIRDDANLIFTNECGVVCGDCRPSAASLSNILHPLLGGCLSNWLNFQKISLTFGFTKYVYKDTPGYLYFSQSFCVNKYSEHIHFSRLIPDHMSEIPRHHVFLWWQYTHTHTENNISLHKCGWYQNGMWGKDPQLTRLYNLFLHGVVRDESQCL